MIGEEARYWNLVEIVETMTERYCDTLAIETEHLSTQEEVDWISERFEKRPQLDPVVKKKLLKSLIEADQFERFLAEKFPATKR